MQTKEITTTNYKEVWADKSSVLASRLLKSLSQPEKEFNYRNLSIYFYPKSGKANFVSENNDVIVIWKGCHKRWLYLDDYTYVEKGKSGVNYLDLNEMAKDIRNYVW